MTTPTMHDPACPHLHQHEMAWGIRRCDTCQRILDTREHR